MTVTVTVLCMGVRATDRAVAIKLMKRIFEDGTDTKRAYREMHILRHLQHPSVRPPILPPDLT